MHSTLHSIGEQLKQAREGRKLSLKQAVQATRIRSYYLEAMEADDFSAIPSSAQARGFLRLYAEYLGLNLEELTARQQSDAPPEPQPPVEQPSDSPQVLVTAPGAEPPSEPDSAAESGKPDTAETPLEPEPEDLLEPEPEPGPPSPSQTIFAEIGASLHERRELLSLTLDEVERHTRVRRHHLEKIETGNFDDLPSPVQARGMLNSYASFLDLDAEALLLRFADALQARRMERQAQQESPRRRKTPLRLPLWLKRFVSADLIFGGGMVLLLLGMSIWGAARLLSSNGLAEATATEGPSISEVLLASPVGGETPTPEIVPTSVLELGTVPPTDAPPELPPGTATPLIEFMPASAVQLTIVVMERTYLKVIVDGEVKQDGRVVPGAALKFDGGERIEILTGSGAALQIIFNQQNLGVMGSFGEVVNRIYTVNGIETPTPTPSPTPSITPRQSPTPTPTLTPLVTITPSP
jgi:cytoskeletal protein RodZ